MTMSAYMRALRAKVGPDLLLVPTVAIIAIDSSQRVLLVRQADGDIWTTPGGMIEPLERPADAAAREMWEETGVAVTLDGIVGVFGGADYTTTYANGDHLAWVATVFAATPAAGTPKPDGEETVGAAYVSRDDIMTLHRAPHVLEFVDAALAYRNGSHASTFAPTTWSPPPPS